MSNRNFRTTLILSALVAIAPMSIDMYLPALPELERSFATDTASVQLTLASFLFGLAIGQMFYGPFADRYGRKPPRLRTTPACSLIGVISGMACRAGSVRRVCSRTFPGRRSYSSICTGCRHASSAGCSA